MAPDRLRRIRNLRSLLEVDVHSLERRPKQRPQSRIVVNEQDAHGGNPPNYRPTALFIGPDGLTL
jgi:hypothetical protein